MQETGGYPPNEGDADANEPWFVDYNDAFGAYEAGKKRRYELLFAVNGGVLAVANIAPAPWRMAILALAMMAFTIAMGVDIWHFGLAFHRRDDRFFGDKGRLVLQAICAILVLAWLGIAVGTGLAARSAPPASAIALPR